MVFLSADGQRSKKRLFCETNPFLRGNRGSFSKTNPFLLSKTSPLELMMTRMRTMFFVLSVVAITSAVASVPNVRGWADSAFGGAPLPQADDFWPATRPPFSFVYDGKSSETFLASWKRDVQTKESTDRIEYHVQWDDPQTGLKVTALATAFKDFPAVEWLLRFENTGAKDSPILENVQALDISMATTPAQNLVLDKINGDDASTNSYVPSERGLKPGESVSLAPVGGRPSNGTFPFFNLQQGSRGFFTAIGWTGQWAASVGRNEAGATHLQAGMELTHLLMHPGESICT